MSEYNQKIVEFYNNQSLNEKQKNLDEEDEKKKSFLDEIRLIQQDIDEIKNKYVVKLDLKPIEKLTESQLLKDAEEQVGKVYDKKVQDLTNSTTEKIDKINLQSQEATKKAETQKDKLEKTYDELDKKASNDAIKKGVQRSSIISEKIKNLSKSKIQEVLNVDNEVADTLYKNNTQIKNLEEEYKKSIANLQTAKAVDVQEKLNDLIREQDKKIVEIINYNNAIKKEEERQNKELENIYSIEGKEKVDALERDKLTKVLNYFFSIPKEQALKELEEPDMKELLGSSATIVSRYLSVS